MGILGPLLVDWEQRYLTSTIDLKLLYLVGPWTKKLFGKILRPASDRPGDGPSTFGLAALLKTLKE